GPAAGGGPQAGQGVPGRAAGLRPPRHRGHVPAQRVPLRVPRQVIPGARRASKGRPCWRVGLGRRRGRAPMLDTQKTIDPRWAWAPYRPDAEAPWDVKRVGHLYRRAAFGSTHAEQQAALKAGPEKTIETLLKGGPGQEEFDRSSGELAESIARANNPLQLR